MLNEDIEKEVLISDEENDEIIQTEIKQSNVGNSFREYSKKVDWVVFLLICLFTLGKMLLVLIQLIFPFKLVYFQIYRLMA